jgi:hypothetical protein
MKPRKVRAFTTARISRQADLWIFRTPHKKFGFRQAGYSSQEMFQECDSQITGK